MKIHNKIYRSLTGEPFHTQKIGDKVVEFFYLNDTQYLAQYVQKGRFYLWTSNGENYRLVIEKGFYEKVSYFFTEDINEIWMNFLDDIGRTNSKTTRLYLGVSLGLSLAVIVASIFLKQQNIGIFVALFIVLISNMIQTSKINKVVKAKNHKAQSDIRDLLTEEGFEQLIKDQDEYYQEYFKFEEDENVENNDELMIEDNTDDVLIPAATLVEELEVVEQDIEEDNILETEITVEEEIEVAESVEEPEILVEEVIEIKEEKAPVKKTTKKVDYNTFTVAQLKDMARDLELTGYSTLRKQELINLIKKSKK